MSANLTGVNQYTTGVGGRNSIEDYSSVFRGLFNSEGIAYGCVVSSTDPDSANVKVTPGIVVIDCGDASFLTFRLKTEISSLAVPNTGTAKYYLVVLKVDLTNATQDIIVVEGTAGTDPNLTEGGSPEVYYVVLARIAHTGSSSSISDAEIVQDNTTITNNSTPEIIGRSVVPVSIPNGAALLGKDSSGSDKTLIGIDKDDKIRIGEDNLEVVVDGEEWQSFTPSWNNLTVGTGTNTGRYKKTGNLVIGYIYFELAADSSVGSAPSFSPPVTPSSNYSNDNIVGYTTYLDYLSARYKGTLIYDVSAGYFSLQEEAVVSSKVRLEALSSLEPFTWTTNDAIGISFMYESD